MDIKDYKLNTDEQLLILQRQLVLAKQQTQQFLSLLKTDEDMRQKFKNMKKSGYYATNDDEFFKNIVYNMYSNGLNAKQIAELLDISQGKIQSALKDHNVFNKTQRDEKIIEYYKAGMSIRRLTKLCHTNWQIVYRVVKAAGLYQPRKSGPKPKKLEG